ncbi:MAG: thioredoxin-dependent thiol peroxidase [Legionellales bacterium]|jgi:thioredoxin-dependent peroxiredoxin|nr:thioredoxin-dependent thiol peroxidase [Legionellales bacterium]
MLKVGDKCPAFTTITETGTTVTNSDYLGAFLIIYFYPKDMTPGCTIESCGFNKRYAEIKSLGAELLGVSKDSMARHVKFKEKHSLEFSLLVDEEAEICNSFGVIQEKSMFGKKYMGIVRSTFLIDPSGKISKIWPKVKITGHVEDVVKSLAAASD